ncbi:MAG: MBL fold metallo-hydrolase [Acidobacteria bacterium]|nr:MBL fold metallo-hydrolase [Acidobacteriota bacterium]MSO60780.1 MBL fold metallo-hydrolase [Acidobacteriota bacterium]
MRRARVLAVIAGVGLAVMTVTAAQQPAPAGPNVAQIEKVKDNLFMITGGGGNTAAYITANGVVLVDTKLSNWGQAILDKVRTVSDKPITHIINTHTHGDHVGSNEFFASSVEVVAQANTSANMAKMKNFATPETKHGLPDRTFTDRMTVLRGKAAIDLYYFGSGHTNGDAFVVFRELRTMHAGDIFARKGTPLLDMNNGGSGVQIGETLAKAAAGIKNVDTVIPGHSTVMTWADFLEYGEFNRAFLAAVQASIKAGKTAEQALAELKLPEKFAQYQMNGAKDNVPKIYAELGK